MGVEHETCRTIHETHLEGILSQKNLTGLAGGFNNGQDPTEGFRRAGTLGPLLAPPVARVEHETCRTIHWIHQEGILSQKNSAGLAGGVRNQFWGRSLKMTKCQKIFSLVATCSEGPLRSI